MVFKFGKKRDVPNQLPDLISDGIDMETTKKEEVSLEAKKDSEKIISNFLKKMEPIPKVEEKAEVRENSPSEFKFNDSEKGFFDELEQNITSELSNIDKMNEWYENKFMPRDILNDMRNYWEGKKDENVLGILGNNFKEKIAKEIEDLRTLEKGWQMTYFELIEKEESLKEKEVELKKVLSEFADLCKRKTKKEPLRRYRKR